MRYILSLFALMISSSLFSQTEGQNFCDVFVSEDYFPLDIKKKKIVWYDTYYYEEMIGVKDINNKKYTEYIQRWKGGNIDTLFLREENGVFYQYEEDFNGETIRFDVKFKKRKRWETIDKKVKYVVKSFKGKLSTPYCEYENLLVIEAELSLETYKFYYKKGYGFIGATINKNDLISYVSPDWSDD